MSGLGFKRRRGFTLVEVMLATVAGTSLLISMTYTSREIKRAVDTAYNEAQLQTIARDLNENLEKRMPMVLGEMAFTSETINMPADVAALPVMRLARPPYGMGAVSLGLTSRMDHLAPAPAATKKPNPNATPTPTPAPTSTPTVIPTATPTTAPTATPTPAPTAAPTATPAPEVTPTPTPTQTPPVSDGEDVEPPEYVGEETEVMPDAEPEIPETEDPDNQTLTLGTFAVRFEDGSSGGSLKYTQPDGTWASLIDIGDRGMIDQSYFAFGGWTPPTSADEAKLRYEMSEAAFKKLITITTKLAKDDMLPFFLQSAWAPRNTWQWVKDTVNDMGSPPTGWSTPPTALNFPDTGGLFPAAVSKDLMDDPSWTEGWAVDVLNGEGTGSFGWASFPVGANNVTLVEELEHPENITFTDAVTGESGFVDVGSNVKTLTGEHGNNWKVPVNQMVQDSKVVTTMVYDQVVGVGSNMRFTIAGFAKWELVGPDEVDLSECVDCDGNSQYLKFVGYADEDGNLMPPGYTPW